MKNELADLPSYIYETIDDKYYAYVGITKKIENANKIKEYFNSAGYDINIKENKVTNGVFVSIVNQYDLILNDAEGEAIGDICSQVINSYEELVVNENKDEGHPEK